MRKKLHQSQAKKGEVVTNNTISETETISGDDPQESQIAHG